MGQMAEAANDYDAAGGANSAVKLLQEAEPSVQEQPIIRKSTLPVVDEETDSDEYTSSSGEDSKEIAATLDPKNVLSKEEISQNSSRLFNDFKNCDENVKALYTEIIDKYLS